MNLFEFFNLLGENPQLAIVAFGFFVVSIIISIAIHEFFHAFAAHKLGDETANFHGRLTLNPLSHLDPIGTILILIAGFGWGKPTPFNPWNLKNPVRDSAIISFAGPLSNFGMALIGAALYHLTPDGLLVKSLLFSTFVRLNIALGIFNLIPLAPLDGFKVVAGLLPKHIVLQWQSLERYGYIIFLALWFVGILNIVVGVPSALLSNILLGR